MTEDVLSFLWFVALIFIWGRIGRGSASWWGRAAAVIFIITSAINAAHALEHIFA